MLYVKEFAAELRKRGKENQKSPLSLGQRAF
jgi:hypothetical protein